MLSAKEYLEQLEEIDICINQDLERLEQIKADMNHVKGIDYSKDRVQTSPGDGLQDSVANYITLSEKINKRVDEFVNAKEQIISEIRQLHVSKYNQVLYKRYVEYKDFNTIANEIGYTYPHTLELHKQALNLFEKTYQNLSYLIYEV